MIRFISIGNQICDGCDSFAFYNTVTSQFINFNGSESFDDIDEFELFAKGEHYYERCKGLIPFIALIKHNNKQRRQQ